MFTVPRIPLEEFASSTENVAGVYGDWDRRYLQMIREYLRAKGASCQALGCESHCDSKAAIKGGSHHIVYNFPIFSAFA